MFDRPSVRDAEILHALERRYQLEILELGFLAIGHDDNAWAFGAVTRSGERLFVKVRRRVDQARMRLARFLADGGLAAVVAPIPARDGSLAVPVGGLHLVLYPFVEAAVAADVGLSDAQWIEYGRIVAACHAAELPEALASSLPREAFRPAWGTVIDALHEAARGYHGEDASKREVAEFWVAHFDEIQDLRRCADALGRRLRDRAEADPSSLPFVPCHADVHTHNLFVEPSARLRVFDWDEAMLAPRERDLMFVLGSPIGLAPGEQEALLFETGYGRLGVDPEALAYYHVDWAVQDIASYGRQALLDDMSDESRAYAARLFLINFDADGEVPVAQRFARALDPKAGPMIGS